MRILPIILLLTLSSCLTDKRINKQIAKATPERVLGLIQKNYPHLFTTRIDTLRDTVQIATIRVDTVVTIQQLKSIDTLTIYKDRLKTKIWIKHDSIFVDSECKGDTVYIEKVITSVNPDRNYYQERWWAVPLSIVFFMFILGGLILLAWWLDKRYYTNKSRKN